MKTAHSEALFERAQQYIPGGVNSPVRAFGAVGGVPRFIARADGSHLFDADGNDYIDYVCSWGPLLLGHRPPEVIAAITSVLESGTSFGAPTAREVELAELIADAVESIEMVRLVNSGTEATMSALRVARGFTGRELVVKFDGCYHGHVDSLLVQAGSGIATLALPDTAGIPKAFAETTISIPFNDLDRVEDVFKKHGEQIACVITEPVPGNMGCVPPIAGYLEGLRRITDRYGALLIFDEVITGFRLARGGAQQLFGVKPDLTTLGKVIGGGLPVGAYGGRADVMKIVAPAGPVYQAGTLSGNPLAVSAGIAMLHAIEKRPELYQNLERQAEEVTSALPSGVTVNRIGSMFTLFFQPGPVRNYAEAKRSETGRFRRFFHHLLDRGIYLPPSQFETAFVSAAHTQRDISATRTAIADFFAGHAAA
jgi:glutamate-1-semialdehyde 2,1-aminomutase